MFAASFGRPNDAAFAYRVCQQDLTRHGWPLSFKEDQLNPEAGGSTIRKGVQCLNLRRL